MKLFAPDAIGAPPKLLAPAPSRRVPRTDGVRTLLRRVSDYEEFLGRAWTASWDLAGRDPWSAGAILVAALRRAFEGVPVWTFDQHLLRMERNAVVYLVPASSSRTVRDASDGVSHPDGRLRSSVLWMRPRTHTPIVWD